MPETIRIYPTHLRSAGPLRVAVGTEEVVIDDDGADVDAALAESLIRFRDATTEAPAAEAEAEPEAAAAEEAPADEPVADAPAEE